LRLNLLIIALALDQHNSQLVLIIGLG